MEAKCVVEKFSGKFNFVDNSNKKYNSNFFFFLKNQGLVVASDLDDLALVYANRPIYPYLGK